MMPTIRDGLVRVAKRLAAGQPLTIALVNDVGFVGGAGKALRRQAQSFLLDGHRVGVVCGLDQANEPPHAQGRRFTSGWLGFRCVGGEGASEVPEAVAALAPDLVVAGNFHWFRWPVELFAAFADRGIPSVAYLHDMHWVSGRCAYSGACRKYIDGCDAACPTPMEYPPLEPARISDAWLARRRIFLELGVPLAANSAWMAGRARDGFGEGARVTLLPLALDERRFAPIDRSVARRLLGLPDGPMVLVGAVDLAERRKGGHLIRAAAPRLAACGATVLAFGHNSQYLPGVRGLGYIEDERVMPVALSACDLFLNVSLEESFGQTLMEAAACAVPSVAIARGGIPEIARDGENALLVPEECADRLVATTMALLEDEPRRRALGAAGRVMVEREYSLAAQARRWRDHLLSIVA